MNADHIYVAGLLALLRRLRRRQDGRIGDGWDPVASRQLNRLTAAEVLTREYAAVEGENRT